MESGGEDGGKVMCSSEEGGEDYTSGFGAFKLLCFVNAEPRPSLPTVIFLPPSPSTLQCIFSICELGFASHGVSTTLNMTSSPLCPHPASIGEGEDNNKHIN